MSENDRLTVKTAAAELGYHPNHVRRMLREGRIKGEKLAGIVWMISRAEVERIKSLQLDGRYYLESSDEEGEG